MLKNENGKQRTVTLDRKYSLKLVICIEVQNLKKKQNLESVKSKIFLDIISLFTTKIIVF